jgi:hypothetical protein
MMWLKTSADLASLDMHRITDPVTETGDHLSHLTKRRALFGSVLQFMSCQNMINGFDGAGG